MSKLKAITAYDAYWKANSVGEWTGILVYLKSEADKYIIDIKQNLLNVEKTLHDLDELDKKEIAHHKYKRCLYMAMWCGDACDKWMMRKSYAIGLGKDGVEYYYRARWKISLFMRWQHRWLKLSEKFKEAK